MPDSSDSYRPLISRAFPRSSSAPDLHDAATAAARMLENNLATFRTQNHRIKIVEAWKDGDGSRPGMEQRMEKLEQQRAVDKAVDKRTVGLAVGAATVIFSLVNLAIAIFIHH